MASKNTDEHLENPSQPGDDTPGRPTEADLDNLHAKYQASVNKFNAACRKFSSKIIQPDIDVPKLDLLLESINTYYDEKSAITTAYLEAAGNNPSQSHRVKHCISARHDHVAKLESLRKQGQDVKGVLEFEADRTLTDKVLMESRFEPATFQAVRQAKFADKAKQLELEYVDHRATMEKFCTETVLEEDDPDPLTDMDHKANQLSMLEPIRDKKGHVWIAAAVHAEPPYYQKSLEVVAKDKQVFSSWINYFKDKLGAVELSPDVVSPTQVVLPPHSTNVLRFTSPPPAINNNRRSEPPRFSNLHSTMNPSASTHNSPSTFDVSYIAAETSTMYSIAGSHKISGTIIERMAGQDESFFYDPELAKSRKDPSKLPKVNGKDVIEFKNFLKLFECKVHRNPKYSWGEKYFELLDALESPAKDCVKLFPADKEGYLRSVHLLETRFSKFETHKGALWARITASEINVTKLSTIHAAQIAGMELLANTERVAYQEVGSMLASLFVSRMSPETKRNWQLFALAKNISDSPSIENFQDWCNYIEREEAISAMAKKQEGVKYPQKQKIVAATTTATANEHAATESGSDDDDDNNMGNIIFSTITLPVKDETYKGCPLCNSSTKTADHQFVDCRVLNALRTNERYQLVRRTGTCRNCLNGHHFARNCKQPVTVCNVCNKEHHQLLHHYLPSPLFAVKGSSLTLFRVVPLDVSTSPNFDNAVRINCSLDEHASESYVAEDLAKSLGAKLRPQSQSVGYLDRSSIIHNYRAKLYIRSVSSGVVRVINANTIKNYNSGIMPPDISSLTKSFPHLRNIDFDPYEMDPCQMLLGLDNLDLLAATRADVIGPLGTPVARHTSLGWSVAFGPSTTSSQTCTKSNSAVAFLVSSNAAEIEHYLSKLWEIESFPSLGGGKRLISVADRSAEITIREGLFRVGKHYGTAVPWKQFPPDLPRNYYQVKKWQANHERELSQNQKIWEQYVANFDEWIRDKYIVPVENSIISGFYIPCFGVFRADSLTMKLRVVTDCARKFGNPRRSLNDAIHTGPKLQNDIREVLLHFRSRPFAFTADIARMYLQFHISERDQQYHRVIYQGQSYQFTRWPFGNVAAPFATLFCLNTHFSESKNPALIRTAKESLYMDDILPSRDDETELLDLFKSMRASCLDAGLELRKLVTNSSVIRNAIDPHLQAYPDNGEPIKALGAYWLPDSDELSYKPIVVAGADAIFTKRNVFRANGLCFDPIGFLEPVTLKGRLILQDVCMSESVKDWDDVIQDDGLIKLWRQYLSELQLLHRARIQRRIYRSNPLSKSLEVFVDASTRMYSTVVYARSVYIDGIHISFVNCRRKLCKKGQKSIPEKELLAAQLGSVVATSITQALPVDQVRFWSDSTTVLKWIYKPMAIEIPFVSRRILEVLELSSQDQWLHVSTEQNPSDLATKGTPLGNLLKSSLWIDGPQFLHDIDPKTMRPDIALKDENRAIVVDGHNAVFATTRGLALARDAVDSSLLTDSYVAHSDQQWAARNLLSIADKFDHSLGVSKLSLIFRRLYKLVRPKSYLACARRMTMRVIQAHAFRDDLQFLVKNGKWKLRSETEKSAAYITDDLLLRARGRLDSVTHVPVAAKRPLLLQKHPAVVAYIQWLHDRVGHDVATNHFALILRRTMYLPKLRQVMRSIIKSCPKCRRLRGQPLYPEMGDRPIAVESFRPFSHISIDYCGPFSIARPRGQITDKRYVLIIVCQQTKACHFEDAMDLSTDAFVNAFLRFCARRGHPTHIRSDQGTNFVGAANLLADDRLRIRKLDWASIRQRTCNNDGLVWSFSPAGAPEFNGLAEIFVRRFKIHLMQAANQKWNEDSFRTAMTEAEGLVNSRPLTYVPENLEESAQVVTPAHFLASLNSDQAVFYNDHLLQLKEYKKVQQFKRQLWQHWIKSVYSDLAARPKWRKLQRNLEVGDVVLLRNRDPFISRPEWPLGVVLEVQKDKNGVNRTAKLKVCEKNKKVARTKTYDTKIVVESISNLIPMSLFTE